MKFTSATVYELLAISEACSALISLVDYPGEPGCRIGASLSALKVLPKSTKKKVNNLMFSLIISFLINFSR